MTEAAGLFTWLYYDTDIDSIPYYRDICIFGTMGPGSSIRIYDVETIEWPEETKQVSSRFCLQVPSSNTLAVLMKRLSNPIRQAEDGSEQVILV